MRILEAKVDALVRLALSEDKAKHDAVMAQLRELVSGNAPTRTVDEEIEDLLLELGVPENIKGYRATTVAIRLAVEDPSLLDALNKGLFTRAADELGGVPWRRIERNVRLAIERSWERCDLQVLRKYFGNTLCLDSAQPTCGMFLARCTREIRRRIGRQEGSLC